MQRAVAWSSRSLRSTTRSTLLLTHATCPSGTCLRRCESSFGGTCSHPLMRRGPRIPPSTWILGRLRLRLPEEPNVVVTVFTAPPGPPWPSALVLDLAGYAPVSVRFVPRLLSEWPEGETVHVARGEQIGRLSYEVEIPPRLAWPSEWDVRRTDVLHSHTIGTAAQENAGAGPGQRRARGRAPARGRRPAARLARELHETPGALRQADVAVSRLGPRRPDRSPSPADYETRLRAHAPVYRAPRRARSCPGRCASPFRRGRGC